MAWLEDVLAAIQGGGAPAAFQPAAASPFPTPIAAPTSEQEAGAAAAAREAAGQRMMRANQRRVDPFGMPDMNSAGIQLALDQAPAGTGVPGPLGIAPEMAPGGSVFPPPNISNIQPFGIPPSMAAAKEMAAPPMQPQAPIAGLEAPIGGAPSAVPPGAPTDVSAQRRPTAPMGVPAPVAAPPPPPEPSLMQRFGGGLSAAAPALLGLGAALSGDQGHLTVAMNAQREAKAQQAETQNLTARALLAQGAPPADVAAALKSPELLKALIGQYYAKDKGVKFEKVKGSDGREVGIWVDPDKKTITAAAVPGMANGDAPLNEAQSRRVQAIIEGREPYPSPNTRSGDAQLIREAVHAADPTFDAVNYNARAATRKNFTAGKAAGNLTAFNTAIGHLGSLSTAIDNLNNSGFPAWNKYVANPVAEQFDPKYQKGLKEFETARTAVADELTRAFRGSGGNVHDIIQWEKAINAADSPAALKAAVRSAAELLNSRIVALGDEYNRGMSTTKDPLELLNPKAAAAFKGMLEGERKAGGPAAVVKPGNYVWKDGALVPQ